MSIYLPLVSISKFAISLQSCAFDAVTPPPAVTPVPAAQPIEILTGIPWGLIIVFIAAGFIITAIKKNKPDQVTVSCCLPLIDEKKMEIEKQKIAEGEANRETP